MIDVEWLDAFVTFAEHLNFTRAARARHVSQPALHAQVKKLGDALGVPLYARRGQRLELTADGHRVLAFGREMRERMRELEAGVGRPADEAPVVLAAGEGAYLYLLGDALRDFAAREAAKLRLLTRDNAGAVEAVALGEAQLGVASLDAPPEGLAADRLTEVAQVLVVPAAHPLARRRAAKLGDLRDARLIVPPAGRPHRAMIGQALRAAGVDWHVAVEAGGWELILRFVELGVGAAIVNACCRIPEGLVAVPLPELPARVYYVLRRPGAPLRGRVAALREALLASGDAWRGAREKARKRPAT